MKIGFIGFGEAASCIASGLYGEGADELHAYDVLLDMPEKREACLAKMEECHTKPAAALEEVIRGAKVILAVVPANYSLAMLKQAAPYLEKNCVYVDLTTASPAEKLEMEQIVGKTDAHFADGAMLGPLLTYKHKVPTLLSGEGASLALERLEPFHMNLTLVEGEAGKATSIKFIRSITAKGIACILFESLQAAQYYHVEDMIVDSLCESYGSSFEKVMDGYVSGTIIHAVRREHEMQNVVDMLKSADLPCEMAETTRIKLEKIGKMNLSRNFTDGVPRSWRGVLAEWGLNDRKGEEK